MLAATYTQGASFEVCEVAEPQVGSQDMLLRVQAASICGSDVKIIRHGHRKLAEGQRIVLGHEFVGVIEQLGTHVQEFAAGQRVGVVPNAGCGHCEACIRGQSNYCPRYTGFGINRDGVHAAMVRVPALFVTQGNVVPIPDAVTSQEASLLEPFSCVVNGVRAARIEIGDTVVMYGAGPMGLMLVLLCRLAGAARIIVVDPIGERRERARSLGGDLALDPGEVDIPDRLRQETGGSGVDAVITACPIAEVQSEAVQVLAPFGRLCLFGGLPGKAGPVPLETNTIHYGNIVVTGSTGGSIRDYRIALRLVAGKRADLTRVISQVFSLDEWKSAYQNAMSGVAGKIVLVAREES